MSDVWSILPWLVVALVLWVSFQVGSEMVRQNGRILFRLEALEGRLARLDGRWVAAMEAGGAKAEHPPGLAPGTPSPELELVDLDGDSRTLSEWRGRRLLLVFFDARCGFCRQLAPDLAALPVDGADGSPLPLLLAGGDAEANRSFVEERGLRFPVLLVDGSQAAARYRAQGTPVGYLVDEEGRIASELAVGAPAVLALAGAASGSDAGAGAEIARAGERAPSRLRPVSESRIAREGLRPGTEAPDFTLPRLGGGEVSLSEYRGRRLLLVFSDPACGPCDLLAGRLGELARRTPEPEVLMVSRRDEEANLRKVKEHGLSFPVVLQRSWEISRRYAMFGTPIAYLIDEAGSIAAEAAVGPDPILALFSEAATVRRTAHERTTIIWREEASALGRAEAG